MDKRKEEQHNEGLFNAGIAGASHEITKRYGNAVKQHYVAYSGEDNELGKKLVKGLKQIAEEKVNPDYRFQNIQQQAGFSAELKDVARSNAEKIIKGDSTRKIRTDDLGNINHPLYDTVTLDANGNVIDGSGTQIKFLGASKNDPTGVGNASRALDKLQSKKFQKYLDADVKIGVPSDQYNNIISEADAKIRKLSNQLDNQMKVGNEDCAKKLQERIDKLGKIKKNLRKSKLSSDEAVFARLHPKLSTAVDVVKTSNGAGVSVAKKSAIIGGSVSIVKNIVAVCKGEEKPEDAIKNVAKDTAVITGGGYVTGFTGSALKGAMQNSKLKYLHALSKANVVDTIVMVSVSASKTLSRYLKGEIDGLECLEILGEQGTGMIASAMFSAIWNDKIFGLVGNKLIGSMIGGMVGYALASAAYGVLTKSLKDAKLAKEERDIIEKICEQHIAMIREHRAEMEAIMNEYLIDSMEVFRKSFFGVKNALAIGDVDWFIDSANEIAKNFGGQVAFSDMDDFNTKMLAGNTFKL